MKQLINNKDEYLRGFQLRIAGTYINCPVNNLCPFTIDNEPLEEDQKIKLASEKIIPRYA